MLRLMPARSLVLPLVLTACQGTRGGDLARPDAADGDQVVDGAGGGAPLAGTIQVAEVHGPYGDHGLVQGTLWDGSFLGFHGEVMNDGTCRLLTFEPSFCDPGCETGMCIDGVCQEYPVTDAGTLTVTGLTSEVVVEPEPFPFAGYVYWAMLEDADQFVAGDPVTASAPGGKFPGFELSSAGVDPLELAFDNDEIGMPNGADYTFTWPAVGQDDGERLRLTLNANNQTHGGPYLAIIECDAPVSAGRFTIPREMVEAFPATEHWEACAGGDCPLSSALRYRRGTAAVADGEVELLVGSQVLFYLVHPAP